MTSNPFELNRFLTDVMIELRSPRGWRPPVDDLRTAVTELEAALIDRDRLRPVLRHLESFADRPPGLDDALTESEETAIRADGLMSLYTLSGPRFFAAISNPLVLLELRAVIFDELPEYWRALACGGHDDSPDAAIDRIRRAAVEERETAVAALDSSAGTHRWTRSTTAGQVVRLEPGDHDPPIVTVEFTLEPNGTGRRLSAELLVPVPLTGSRCTAVLLTLVGAEIGRYEGTAEELSFPFGEGASPAGIVLGCEYVRGSADRIRFALSVAEQ